MADFITPKTNWKSTDFLNITDWQRIGNNITCLSDYVNKLYGTFSCDSFDTNKTYSSSPTDIVGNLNIIENDLVAINEKTYNLNIGDSKTWVGNTKAPNYEDLNRIEGAILMLYSRLDAEYKALNKLAFTLGGAKGFKI